MCQLTLENVGKDHASTRVLGDVSIEVGAGELLVLVGPSGCGKSTLLRCIAGLETLSRGTIKMDGRDITNVEPRDRDIAMVFQSYALYPHLTVRENLAFGLKMRKTPKAEIETRINEVATMLGLDSLLARKPAQLSGGQRQRVAMGRAVVRRPKVFLFDEPLSNLDAKLRVQMRTEIKALHQRLRTTSVYVTHDQVEAMTMADRIVVMHDGRVEQIGTPLELYDRPVNLFVAGFIGSPAMNFIDGTLRREDGRAWIETKEHMMLPVPGNAAGRDGQAVVYGIRPEHLAIAGDGADGVKATVQVVEPTGAETFVYAELGATQLCAVFTERYDFRAGATIRLAPRRDLVHLFDAQSGRKLG